MIEKMQNNTFDPKSANSVMLAYLGDAVWELLVRERLFSKVAEGSAEANRLALEYVTALAQAEASHRLDLYFTDEEKDVFRRGKNTKSHNVPKSVSRYEYRLATGLEAVFGYNYIMNRQDRNRELFNFAFPTEANC